MSTGRSFDSVVYRLLEGTLVLPTMALETNRLHTSGFEEALTIADLLKTTWNVGSAAVERLSIVSAPTNGGLRALRFLHPGLGGDWTAPLRQVGTVPDGTYLYGRIYLRVKTRPTVSADGNATRVAALTNTFGDRFAAVCLKQTKWALRNEYDSAHVNGNTALDLDTWYRLEWRTRLQTSKDWDTEARLYLGESTTPLETLTLGKNLGGLPLRPLFGFEVAPTLVGDLGMACEMFFDDTAAGWAWIGPGRTALWMPNADDTVTWARQGSTPKGTNWEGLAEPPNTPDDAVAYNATSTLNAEDRLRLDGSSVLGAPVLAHWMARVSSNTTGTQALRLRVRDEQGQSLEGPDITPGGTAWRILTPSEDLVITLAGRSPFSLSGLKAGYIATGGSGERRITTLVGNVEYV